MDLSCPNCLNDLTNKKVLLKYFKNENGINSSGYYYQCPICLALLKKREHSIEVTLKSIPVLMFLLVGNFLIWSRGFGYELGDLFVIILIMLTISFNVVILFLSKKIKNKIPKNWSPWVLYAKANKF